MPITGTIARTDEQIRGDVSFELQWDPKITSSDIALAVKDGVVALSGYAKTYGEKDSAARAALRVAGVRGVANDIQVSPASARSDPEIARQAVEEFENHCMIPANQIRLTVNNGWITLVGAVEWQFQRTLAESCAGALRGVLGVTNNIDVHPRISPATLQTSIEKALQGQSKIDGGGIRVEVVGDCARLFGTASSEARERAERAAWSVSGIRRVENHIVIEGRT